MHCIDSLLIFARNLLQPIHELYTSTISSKGMALSLETAALIWVLCEERKPSSVLDLGSGFSSFVIRSWAKQNATSLPVWSVDDDTSWLQRSKLFCEEQGVGTTNFATWVDFQREQTQFDLVIYDLGRMQCRSKNLVRALNFRSPDGVVVVDDMHKFNYAKEVRQAIGDLGLVGTDMREATTDAHEGRHCWLVTKD
jgi:predicted O-methyltransferase YrrM